MDMLRLPLEKLYIMCRRHRSKKEEIAVCLLLSRKNDTNYKGDSITVVTPPILSFVPVVNFDR